MDVVSYEFYRRYKLLFSRKTLVSTIECAFHTMKGLLAMQTCACCDIVDPTEWEILTFEVCDFKYIGSALTSSYK